MPRRRATSNDWATTPERRAGILAPFADKRVLFVDDEVFPGLRMQSALEEQGIKVVRTARDGDEGLALHEAEPFDIILLNNIMHRMDGIELLGILRGRGDDVPVIMHSASARDYIERRCRQLRLAQFVQSPFLEEDYVEVVRQVLLEADAARRTQENASGEGKRQ